MLETLLQAHLGLFVFLVAVFASLGLRISSVYHPNLLLYLTFKAVAERVYKPKANTSYQTLAGTLGFVLPILTTILLTFALLQFAFYPEWLSGLVLFLCLDASHEDKAKRIAKLLSNHQKVTARAVLKSMVAREVDQLSEMGISKATLDSTVLNSIRQFFVVASLYALLGPYIALLYKLLMICDHAWRKVAKPNSAFIKPIQRTIWFIEYLPIRILVLFFMLLLNGKQSWHYIKHYGRHYPQSNSGWILSFFAANLNIQLAGPRFYLGERYNVMRIGSKQQPCSEAITDTLKLLTQMRWLFIATLALLMVCANITFSMLG
ncbi:cobalamin biosynthesis protein CobD/CbiB [Pseudoalteromonas sp. T1lg65]|uniref:cobalamin biosynthesis protein CobD/CbiB n=1 Tax=Pseudoalteromonas sp. T1lg65 TaxID=2077101 RepID=UPI003F7A8B8D